MTAYRKFRKWNIGFRNREQLFPRSGIAFYFHLLSTVQVTVRPKTNKNMCVHGHISKKSRIGPWASEVIQDFLTPAIEKSRHIEKIIMLSMDNSWDMQMEKFEKLHGHLEMVLLFAKIKKKSFLWNLLFHALVNYLKMSQNVPFWM
jgi:hypothetical protein